MRRERVIVESPLRGATPEEQRENFRYLLWCCRAEYLRGNAPIASHLVCPWFMDDACFDERRDGIDSPWAWGPTIQHRFYMDRGASEGMAQAALRCKDERIPFDTELLVSISPRCHAAWQRGEWPPHTAGFEVSPRAPHPCGEHYRASSGDRR